MTTDDILRMAREAGLQPYYDAQEPAIERFFKLAYEAGAAAERSRMIADGWRQCAQGQKTTQFCGMVEQEREACAIAGGAAADAGRDVAAAIRARGTQDPKVTHLNEWARGRLARHGIQIPEDDDANPSF